MNAATLTVAIVGGIRWVIKGRSRVRCTLLARPFTVSTLRDCLADN
jgi:hypothetical protein